MFDGWRLTTSIVGATAGPTKARDVGTFSPTTDEAVGASNTAALAALYSTAFMFAVFLRTSGWFTRIELHQMIDVASSVGPEIRIMP